MTPEELKEVRATHAMQLKQLESMDTTSTTGPMTLWDRLSQDGLLHTLAPEDHPIYKQGSTISAVNLKAL